MREFTVRRWKRPGRPSPWACTWYVPAKPPRTRPTSRSQFFRTREKREHFVAELLEQNRKYGLLGQEIDPVQHIHWKRLDESMGTQSLEHAVDFYLAHHGNQNHSLSDAIEEFLYDRSKRFSQHYCQCLKPKFRRFFQEFGDVGLMDVSPIAYRRWLAKLKLIDLSDMTIFLYHGSIQALYNFCVGEGMLRFNPLAKVRAKQPVLAEPQIVNVDNAELFFAVNCDRYPDICGLTALTAFAGMRVSTMLRLRPEDIRESGILTPAANTKTKRRHYIEGFPLCLSEWLELLDRKDFTPRRDVFHTRRAKAYKNVGQFLVENHRPNTFAVPAGAWKRSFVSYMCAVEQSAAKVAMITGNRTPDILWNHYMGNATREEGLRYFQITPQRSEEILQEYQNGRVGK